MGNLFDRIPESLFSPLSGPNRRIYATLLVDLYALFFDQVHAEVFPSRETVRAEIEEHLARMAVSQLAEEGDAEPDTAVPEAGVAQRAYRRLRDAGWLEEEPDGYGVRVTVPPAVATLWAALLEVARPERVFYGGMVLSIFNNVQRALDDPEGQVLALRQAAVEATRFRQHLNAMIYGLKGLLGAIADLEDHRQVLGRFFEDFVERFLVADYKRLKTRNNPFRFRHEILKRVRELEFDVERKQRLVSGYLEQTGLEDSEAAWRGLNRDIAALRGTFEQVDEHLARVDRFRARVERRVADTVRYLDRSQPGFATRLAGLLDGAAGALAALPDDSDALPVLPIGEALPASRHGLRSPSLARRAPDPRPLREQAMDPSMLARQQALRSYMERRRLDPRRIAAYLERQLQGRDSLMGEELVIESVEDLLAFTHLRHLPYLPGAERIRRHYRIERLDGEIDNELVRCPRFRVHRVKPLEAGRAA